MRLDPGPTDKNFHVVIVSEIGPGEALLDSRGVSDR